MSNFLAVDTSSRYLTVVACKGKKKVVRYFDDCAMQHSVRLMDEIDAALDEAELTPGECDFFAAVTGPGSFTGIRIGLSCVKGYAVALGKKAVGVTVFDMLSYNVNSGCDYLVAVDAAHGNYYVCGYKAVGLCDIEPCFLTRDELLSLGRPIYGFEELDLEGYTAVGVRDCLYTAAVKAYETDGEPKALYIKKPQAQELMEARRGV